MSERKIHNFQLKNENLNQQISPSPSPITVNHQSNDSSSSSSSSGGNNRISPIVLFIIVLLSVIFFICSILHLLVRYYLKKKRSSLSSSPHESDQNPEFSDSDTYQRQLQQLFHLHDSGLDQALIDALPVFLYKEIKGTKEPFDCAVCLCEFSEDDKLRLLPNCSHAFHIDCIDTWLLSNSTCPLCRGTLFSLGHQFEYPDFNFGFFAGDDGGVRVSPVQKPAENEIGKRVFSVRLGKFRSSNIVNNGEVVLGGGGETSGGCVSSSSLDNRRCFSMGSYQYIVAESDLVVALCPNNEGLKNVKEGESNNKDVEGKKINMRSKGESFSVSKIWQWSNKRSKFPNNPSETNLVVGGSSSSYACSGSGSTVAAGLALNGRRFQGP
ncbi:Zinc finger RING-type [Arabidopsis thaliana x Arabidopsis arenosa]|uniref:RING-type E3 ubiquitin transferase n=1 Tax=Arabidopsis thaliana x Arabidopsis arenosa TaxID=1240361 RepID=A0A8T2C446_9BRAS|nr:Zinc finger RING-type [Arabidopsis thaliana x Arabidopsis arenosa]